MCIVIYTKVAQNCFVGHISMGDTTALSKVKVSSCPPPRPNDICIYLYISGADPRRLHLVYS